MIARYHHIGRCKCGKEAIIRRADGSTPCQTCQAIEYVKWQRERAQNSEGKDSN